MANVNVLHTSRGTSKGGRNGHTKSGDGMVNLDLSVPKDMGGPGKPNTSTPEDLFAAGYAACLGGAIDYMAGQLNGRDLPAKFAGRPSYVQDLAPPGMVLRMAMSVEEALLPRAPRRVCAITPAGLAMLDEEAGPGQKLTAARRRVLQALHDDGACSTAELARRAGCGAGVVRGLIAAGDIGEEWVSSEPSAAPIPDWDAAGPQLSADQAGAAHRLVERVGEGGFSVTVLDGVTGSGKTETYFAAIAAALAAGRQVLVLLPEIALGAQWLDRFRRRFGAMPAEWHSDVSQSARRDTWRAVANGPARIVVGARSALFLPFAELGLVVVDEEHDASYKQEDGVCYQARDMAVLRASIAKIPIILVSATPSLETVVNVSRDRYRRVHLPRRHAEASLPKMPRVPKLTAEMATKARPTVSARRPLCCTGGHDTTVCLSAAGLRRRRACGRGRRPCGSRWRCRSSSRWRCRRLRRPRRPATPVEESRGRGTGALRH